MELAGASSMMRERPFTSSPVTTRRISGRFIAGDPQPGFAHVVAAQLTQRVPRELGGDVLAPVKIEVGVVQRLRARSNDASRFVDHVVLEFFSTEEFVRLFHQERPRSDGAERDSEFRSIRNCGSNPENGKIERAAPAQFPVSAPGNG